MNVKTISSLILFGIYLMLIAVISYRNSRSKTVEGYAIGNRKISFLGTLAALVSSFRDGAGLAVWVSMAYYFGFGALWLTVGLSTGLLLLVLVAENIKVDSDKHRYITVGDFIEFRTGKITAYIASVAISMTSVLFAASQLYVAGKILGILFDINPQIGIVITAGLVASYLIVGGYKTVVQTDIMQWGIIMLIVIIPFFIHGDVMSKVHPLTFFSLGLRNIIGFSGISMLVAFSSADVWQRIFSAKDKRVAQYAFLTTIPTYFLVSIGLILLGLALQTILASSAPQNAFFDIFSSVSINPIVIAILGIFSMAAVASVLDTEAFLFATTLTRNLYPNTEEGNKFIRRTQINIVGLFVVLVAVSFTIQNIVSFLFGAVTLVTVLAPLLFYSGVLKIKFSKRTDVYVGASIAISCCLYFYLFVTGAYSDLIKTLYPALLEFVLLTIIILPEKIIGKTAD